MKYRQHVLETFQLARHNQQQRQALFSSQLRRQALASATPASLPPPPTVRRPSWATQPALSSLGRVSGTLRRGSLLEQRTVSLPAGRRLDAILEQVSHHGGLSSNLRRHAVTVARASGRWPGHTTVPEEGTEEPPSDGQGSEPPLPLSVGSPTAAGTLPTASKSPLRTAGTAWRASTGGLEPKTGLAAAMEAGQPSTLTGRELEYLVRRATMQDRWAGVLRERLVLPDLHDSPERTRSSGA